MIAHHAYVYEGPMSLFGALKDELKPFWAREFERFGVEDARALVALASLKQSEQTFFIAAASITTEAQQALLKLLEEPQDGTSFVFLLPHGVLLPTLRSRMQEYPRGGKGEALERHELRPRLGEPRKFLKSNQKERSDEITKMLKDDEGTKERVREFIDALERECVKLNFMQKKEGREALHDIAMVRGYLGDRSPSLKMLLEHLALCLPKS